MVNSPPADLVTGFSNFEGDKLNVLQVGLGTFGTFIQNLTVPDEAFPGVTWLLEACSDGSHNIKAVGVEPVPEHTDRLRQLMQGLPGAALVQAAVSSEEEDVQVHAITAKCYAHVIQELTPEELESFHFYLSFLRNMACVDQNHPDIVRMNEKLEELCGVSLETESISARALTYASLARMLQFRGVEVLLVDAEGYDSKILQSLMNYCSEAPGNEWPDVIQFETMGHANRLKGSSGTHDEESATCSALEAHGYVVACRGKDTQLVREAALASEPRLQTWVRTFRCWQCQARRSLAARPGALAQVCSAEDSSTVWGTDASGRVWAFCSP